MTILRASLLVVAGLAAKWAWPLPATAGGFVPDLTLAVVVVLAATMPPERALVLAVATGLLEGALTAAPLGARALTLVLVAYLAGRLARSIQVESSLARIVTLASAALAAVVFEGLFCQLALEAPGLPTVHSAAGRVLATCVAGSLVWRGAPPARASTPW